MWGISSGSSILVVLVHQDLALLHFYPKRKMFECFLNIPSLTQTIALSKEDHIKNMRTEYKIVAGKYKRILQILQVNFLQHSLQALFPRTISVFTFYFNYFYYHVSNLQASVLVELLFFPDIPF